MNETREKEIREISVEEIIPNRFQPRLAFDENELKSLSESIKLHGIIQPLVLRRVSDKYEIIAGERRYKAACMAGLTKVPAIIMEIDDNKSAELAVVENLQRKNLTAIEEAQSYKKILDKGYVTQEELASRMGVSQPTIANKLRLLNLTTEVRDALLANKISERHARSLLQIGDANIQVQMLNRIMTERLTVRQTDEEIAKLLGKPIPQPVPQEVIQPTPSTTTPETNMFDNPSEVSNEMIPENNQNLEDNIFNVKVEDIKNHAEDIIKTPEPANLDMLLKTETKIEEEKYEKPKNIDLEETEANVNMGEIVDESKVPFNPFIEETPEVVDFLDTPQTNANVNEPTSSIINEFREIQAQQNVIPPTPEPVASSLSQAINTSRDTIRKLENLGFQVDTEEFDFEDMYQIIIKIKK